MEIGMIVKGVGRHPSGLILLLQTTDGKEFLPIAISHAEAHIVELRLQGIKAPRPLTHTLLLKTLEELGAALEKVVIMELRDNWFHAQLHLSTSEGVKLIDARPIDAVVLALEAGVEIYVEESVLKAIAAARDDPASQETRSWFESLDPDDLDKM